MHEHHEHRHEQDQKLLAGENEEPCVCSFSRAVQWIPQTTGMKLAERYGEFLAGLRDWCAESGCLVGHIKLHLQAGEHSYWASCTGSTIHEHRTDQWNEQALTSCRLDFTAIVFQVSHDELEDRVHSSLPK